MAVIAYLHDGTSVYDELFLEHLTKKNSVYFLTFHNRPRFVPKKATIITIREPLRLFADKEWMEGIRMYALFLLRALLIRLHLKRIKVQLVIGCMATKYGFYSTVLGYRPTVIIVWGTDVLIAPKRFFFFRFMAKYAFKNADAVILDSQVQKNAAIQLGCSPNKILKFPWFDLESVSPKKSRDEIREKLGWRDNVIILSARSHEPIYGVEHLIEAIPKIVKEVTESRFLIIGGGHLTQSFKERVRELHIEKYVKFTGNLPREDVVAYVNASDIYVSTSLSDGTSASLLEAMTLTVPSVVTEIPGNKEWIKNGYNGYLIPVKDSKSLSEKIIQLIKNKEIGKKLGENARKTVEARVNWRKNMEAFGNLILRLINQKHED